MELFLIRMSFFIFSDKFEVAEIQSCTTCMICVIILQIYENKTGDLIDPLKFNSDLKI